MLRKVLMSASLALAGCVTVPDGPVGRPAGVSPPVGLPPLNSAVQAIYGEWKPLDAPNEANGAVLTIWSPMFSWGSGCRLSQGQLRDLGENQYAIELAPGGFSESCRSFAPLAPFDGVDVTILLENSQTMRVVRGDRSWRFAKINVAATLAREDFVRGEWLLADERGRPFRGGELTRVTFGGEYKVEAPNCSVSTNSWFSDRDQKIRIGGSYTRISQPCRTKTLGDQLAKIATAAEFIAEPVETRLTVRVGDERLTLIPAAHFPELAKEAEAIAPDRWAQRLAAAGPDEASGASRLDYAVQAIGLARASTRPDEGQTALDQRRQAFAGLTSAQYEAAQQAGLLPMGDASPSGLQQHLAAAPIVVRAVLEGVRPVDRGDGLALDYQYRVREGWRGDRHIGDLVLVRMPPLLDKGRSPAITPEPGAEVLLLASRSGYIAGRIIDGEPPSADRRVVAMTLPLMRIVKGQLVEAIAGSDVLGAASFAGMPVAEARRLAKIVDAEIQRIAPLKSANLRRYFIARIGDPVLSNPTRLWIEYDHDLRAGNPRGHGGVVTYMNGCSPMGRQILDGKSTWGGAAIACHGRVADGLPITEPAVAEAVRWIEANGFPDTICAGGVCQNDDRNKVPLAGGEVELREMLR